MKQITIIQYLCISDEREKSGYIYHVYCSVFNTAHTVRLEFPVEIIIN